MNLTAATRSSNSSMQVVVVPGGVDLAQGVDLYSPLASGAWAEYLRARRFALCDSGVDGRYQDGYVSVTAARCGSDSISARTREAEAMFPLRS